MLLGWYGLSERLFQLLDCCCCAGGWDVGCWGFRNGVGRCGGPNVGLVCDGIVAVAAVSGAGRLGAVVIPAGVILKCSMKLPSW